MKKVERVSVVGAGIMGSGIANAIFKQGLEVKLFDINSQLLQEAFEKIKSGARRNMDVSKIKMAQNLEDAAQDADLVIEAVIEDMKLKGELFSKLNTLAPAHTIFASNTSSLSISEMGRLSQRPDRFIGLHFFNPAFLMRLVEIIVSEKTSKSSLELASGFIENVKKTGVRCKESPGFIVNRILIPMINEAFYSLEEKQKASGTDLIQLANDMDSAMVNGKFLLMGPIDLADLTGLDTAYKVSEIIHEGFKRNPRYATAPLLKNIVEQKRFGRKSGAGVYQYTNNANDPDLNPCLDAKGGKIVRLEKTSFDAMMFLAVVANEAFRVIEEGIVENYKDIELCMELGTRWPKGPFGLVKQFGLENMREALKKRYMDSGKNPRYEVSSCFLKPPAELTEYFKGE